MRLYIQYASGSAVVLKHAESVEFIGLDADGYAIVRTKTFGNVPTTHRGVFYLDMNWSREDEEA